MKMRHVWLALGWLVLLPTSAWSLDRPLLMEGKQALFQRVLSTPEATLHTSPGSSSKDDVVPFTVFYVYQRQQREGLEWLQVGLDSYGNVAGWMPAQRTIVWNQALTVSFKNPQDIDRVLLFEQEQDLNQLVQDRDLAAYQKLYDQAAAGTLDKNSPVIAIQPEGPVDIRESFYLVPIKQHRDVFVGSELGRLLEVATVPLRDDEPAARPVATPTTVVEQAPSKLTTEALPEYRSGIHFVIDSTASMGPYIDRTRETMRKVYGEIARHGLTDQVRFGITAYRDNPEIVPEVDYLTRNYVSLERAVDGTRFLELANSIEPAEVSTRDFREDAYAGIKAAIETTDWSPFAARYVVLITDAGPREANDSLGATRFSADTLRQLAQDSGVAIWVLHLRTPSLAANHERAEGLYRALSYYPGIGDFYYGVKLGEVDEFGSVLEALSQQLTEQVVATVNGVPPLPGVLPEQGANLLAETESPATQPESAFNPQLEQLQEKVAQLGYALRMQYLHQQQGQELPEVFNAWMLDRDFKEPYKAAVDVRVLLTRDQLSDLKNVLQQVLDSAQEGVLSPAGFLNDLKSLAASVSRDPSAVARSTVGEGGNLADMGYMREYIEDLPYTGEVMNQTLENWEEMSVQEQVQFMHRLESKISYYQALHDHTDLWVTPGGGPVNGDSVFPVVLELLP